MPHGQQSELDRAVQGIRKNRDRCLCLGEGCCQVM